jgi:hypothetical protein
LKTYIQWIVYFKKEKHGEFGGWGSLHKLYSMHLPVKRTWFVLSCTSAREENLTSLKIGTGLSQKWEIHFTCILHLLNNTCVKHNFKNVHVSNLFWSREYNSAKEVCQYPSFSKVGSNYPLDLKIIWSSVYAHFSSHFSQQLLMAEIWYLVTSFI